MTRITTIHGSKTIAQAHIYIQIYMICIHINLHDTNWHTKSRKIKQQQAETERMIAHGGKSSISLFKCGSSIAKVHGSHLVAFFGVEQNRCHDNAITTIEYKQSVQQRPATQNVNFLLCRALFFVCIVVFLFSIIISVVVVVVYKFLN